MRTISGLEAGADPDATADRGFTPLDSAVANGNEELAELLRASRR